MRNNTSQTTQDSIHQTQGVMIALMQRLSNLAPHPDTTTPNAMSIARINSDITPAAEYDGMMGSIGLDAGLGGAFAGAAAIEGSNIAALDNQAIWDALSEYLKDKDSSNNNGRGKGSIALGEHKTICNTFNALDEQHAAISAFYENYEERAAIEKHLVACDRNLSLLKREQAQGALEFALAA